MPGLEASAFFDPSNFVYPFGTHICTVEVDIDTGVVKILRYIAVDDCGPPINPAPMSLKKARNSGPTVRAAKKP